MCHLSCYSCYNHHFFFSYFFARILNGKKFPVNTSVCANWDYIWYLSLKIARYHGRHNPRTVIRNCLVKPPMLDRCLKGLTFEMGIWTRTHIVVLGLCSEVAHTPLWLSSSFVLFIYYSNYLIHSTYSLHSYFTKFLFSYVIFIKLLIYNWVNWLSM